MNLLKKDIAIVSVLVAVLFGLSYYKVMALRTQAHGAITEKNLAAISDAVAVYRGDNEGRCPQSLNDLVPDYLFSLPHHHAQNGQKSNAVKNGRYEDMLDGKGGWIFVTDQNDLRYCSVFINEINQN